ncbi:MAG: zinc-ribbon domain-containing protein [Candidatus Acidulodesulfobacterium sp.]
MDINCPYCGTHYELNEPLIPEGDVKVKCRVCSNVFTLNKKTGVVKDNIDAFSGGSADEKTDKTFTVADSVENASNNAASEKDEIQNNSKNLSDMPEDFMKSIISEINSAVAEESAKTGADKDVSKKPHAKEKEKEKKGASPFQISMVILLGIVFLIAIFSFLVHYGVINAGFLPPAVSEILSSF